MLDLLPCVGEALAKVGLFEPVDATPKAPELVSGHGFSYEAGLTLVYDSTLTR